jgi:hypothetical protein
VHILIGYQVSKDTGYDDKFQRSRLGTLQSAEDMVESMVKKTDATTEIK